MYIEKKETLRCCTSSLCRGETSKQVKVEDHWVCLKCGAQLYKRISQTRLNSTVK